jgi:hypothetical protein
METKDSGLNPSLREEVELISPDENYMGKSLSEWIGEYTNWLIQPNPDANNDGEVVFLRGFDFHYTSVQTFSKSVGPAFQDIEPVIMVGKESLYVDVNKPILFPIIMAIGESIDTKLDDNQTCRINYVRSIFDGYSAKSKQVTIDEKDMINNNSAMNKHHVESSEFTLNVPDAPYGSSLKDSMKLPLRTPGKRSSVVSGIFFMLRFLKKSPDSHILRFYSDGGRKSMLCDSDALYNIGVVDTMGEVISHRHYRSIIHKLNKKLESKEIEKPEYDKLKKIEDMIKRTRE